MKNILLTTLSIAAFTVAANAKEAAPTVPAVIQTVVESYVENYCHLPAVGLEKYEVTSYKQEQIPGYTAENYKATVTVKVTFGDDDNVFEENEKLVIEKYSNAVGITEAAGPCPVVIKHK